MECFQWEGPPRHGSYMHIILMGSNANIAWVTLIGRSTGTWMQQHLLPMMKWPSSELSYLQMQSDARCSWVWLKHGARKLFMVKLHNYVLKTVAYTSTELQQHHIIVTVHPVYQQWWQHSHALSQPQIAKFMGPTRGPPGSCRPQMGPMLAPWTLLSGAIL